MGNRSFRPLLRTLWRWRVALTAALQARADGAVFAWGADVFGSLNVPANLTQLDVPIGSSLNPNQTGPQSVTYSATNSDGSVSIATRTVVVRYDRADGTRCLGTIRFLFQWALRLWNRARRQPICARVT